MIILSLFMWFRYQKLLIKALIIVSKHLHYFPNAILYFGNAQLLRLLVIWWEVTSSNHQISSFVTCLAYVSQQFSAFRLSTVIFICLLLDILPSHILDNFLPRSILYHCLCCFMLTHLVEWFSSQWVHFWVCWAAVWCPFLRLNFWVWPLFNRFPWYHPLFY